MGVLLKPFYFNELNRVTSHTIKSNDHSKAATSIERALLNFVCKNAVLCNDPLSDIFSTLQ